VEHEPFLRNYLCKWPGDDSDLYLHRDWMYVDEVGEARTYVVWIPLVDVTSANGPLQVLPRSHRIDRSLRGSHLNAPWVADDDLVRHRLVSVTARVGEAVVFDNALVHCSPVNAEARPRLVAAVALRPPGAPLVHHRGNEDGSASRWEVDEAFFVTITPQELLDHPISAPEVRIEHHQPPLSSAQVATALDAAALAPSGTTES
jgi:hypothetical protein